MKAIPVICVSFLFMAPYYNAQSQIPAFPFWDHRLPIEQRINDVVSRLTLEEKVAQMLNSTPAIPRLGIPGYDWWNEVLHGVARTSFHVTVFPQAIGMAATFDTNSLYTMADYSALEGRAIHNKTIESGKTGDRYVGLTYWTPNINIFRDPRWGRGQETYGEDPFLTAMLGKAFVRGLQGEDPKYLKAVACAKHFAVHSGPESSRHAFDVNVSEYDLWDTYLPAFRELVVNAKVGGVMCAYNALRTQPCCANDLLMNDILRNRWKFSGYVTSDCGAINDFFNFHKTHPNAASAAADALIHGTDIDCGNTAYKALVQAVKDGLITEKQIDVSLKRLFRIRFRLGMFDPPAIVKYAQTRSSVLESPAHKAHALKMARQSIVLLRNENNILPLSKKIKKIAVLGPNADNPVSVLGNYNGTPSEIVTPLKGIRSKLDSTVEIVYEKAVNFTGDTAGNIEKTDFIGLAARIKDADAIIYIGGISPELEGEEMRVKYSGFSGGDRTTITLPSIQTELMKVLKATGRPVVFVMMTGSAIAIPWEAENIPGILNAWYGGQSAGTAIADVLFGDYNPAGRLPVTFYRSDTDLPDFNSYSMENRTYRYFTGRPLYPFGYGLSYTGFYYDQLNVPSISPAGKSILVTVNVTNSGGHDGEEVVQLYISHQGQSGKFPIRALKGFKRINLKAGETRKITFVLTTRDLSLVNDKGMSYQPKGKITISLGGGQPDQSVKTSSNVLKDVIIIK
jgi:beta-glucosidase